MAGDSIRKCRVFVVDDERVIASTIAVILKQAGFDASEFYSGECALEAMKELEPDILISDLVMPFMSGIDLAVEVRKNFPKCRIMLFSGHINTTVLLEPAQQRGYYFEVHTKPISPAALLEKVRTLSAVDLL